MELSYNTNSLRKSLTSDKEIIKKYGAIAKNIRRKLNILESASNLEDISKLPQLRLHSLIGDRDGEWSIDINGNWRILFEIANDPIPMLDKSVNFKEVTHINILSIKDTH